MDKSISKGPEYASMPLPIPGGTVSIEGEKIEGNFAPPVPPTDSSDQAEPKTIQLENSIPSTRTLRNRQRPNYKLAHEGPTYKPREPKEAAAAEVINNVCEIMLECAESPEYPNSVAEAHKSFEWPDWEKAINAELELLAEKGTWELVELPPERKAIGNRWVFIKKFDEHGNLA
jgi:hypothetical protein